MANVDEYHVKEEKGEIQIEMYGDAVEIMDIQMSLLSIKRPGIKHKRKEQ